MYATYLLDKVLGYSVFVLLRRLGNSNHHEMELDCYTDDFLRYILPHKFPNNCSKSTTLPNFHLNQNKRMLQSNILEREFLFKCDNIHLTIHIPLLV